MDRFSRRWQLKCPVTSTKEVLSLLADVKKKSETVITDPNKWPELELLKDKIVNGNITEVFTACQAFVELVETKVLGSSKTVSLLLSTLPSIYYYTPLVMAIGDILLYEMEVNDGQSKIEYNFQDKLHPFGDIIRHDSSKGWSPVLCYMQSLLENRNLGLTNTVNLFKPLLLYVFVNPDYRRSNYRSEVIDLLLEHVDKPEIKLLIFELFSWNIIDINSSKLIMKITNCYLNFPEEEEKKQVLATLMPYLAETIKWLIGNGFNPLPWIDLLSKALKVTKEGSSATLYILSDTFLETPLCFINRLAEVCTSIIYSCSCNKYMAYNFLASSLLWMVNPSPAEEPLMKILENVTKFLAYNCEPNDWNRKTSNLNANPYFKIMRNSNTDVKYAIDTAIISDSWNDKASLLKWMNSLLTSNYPHVQATLQTLVAGIILSENDDELLDVCLKILLNTSQINFNLSFSCLCFMFYKLCRESEPKNQLKYFRSLATLAKSREIMGLVVGIIELVKNKCGPTVLPIVIDLYLMIWKKNTRVYPYLHRALFVCPTEYESSWELNTVKALAIREICESSPEVHGKNLVSKLNDILNNDKSESGMPTAIAIEAVTELCNAQVIDIFGAWKALRPKLIHDTRPEVITRLCMFFGEIPELTLPSSYANDMFNGIISKLWECAFSENMQLVKPALASLAKFGPDAYCPQLLPDILKKDVVLSREHFKELRDMSKDQLFQNLEYIPGECWIELLYKIDSRARTDAGNMLTGLIDKELLNFPKRYFYYGDSKPEPENYSHLPLSSICRAAERHIKEFLSTLKPEQKKVPRTLVEILRIFSMEHCRGLPYLNWTFLTRFLTMNEVCKRYAILILAKQASSKGCKKIFENYILDNLPKYNDVNEFMFLFSILPLICTHLTPNTLKQFLEKTFRSSFHSSLHAGTDHFESVIKAAAKIVERSPVPESRKQLLTAQLQNIVTLIPPEHEDRFLTRHDSEFSVSVLTLNFLQLLKVYAKYAHLLPTKCLEAITCPSYWPQITCEKIRQSLIIKTATIVRPDSLEFISSLGDMLDTVCHFPSESEVVICCVMEILQKIRHLNHTTWFLELLLKVESSSSSLSMRGSVEVTLFYLDLFIISVITVIGYDFLLLDKDEHVIKSTSHKLFPFALHKYLSWSEYAITGPKVLESIYNLLQWKRLPLNYAQVLQQALFANRGNMYCIEQGKWRNLLHMPKAIKFE